MSWQYRIEGSDLQYVELTLSPGDSVIGEPGAMMYADEGVSIETHMGDGDGSGVGARLTAGFKRTLTGENFFVSVSKNTLSRPLRVCFAAPSPGKIIAIDLASVGGALICQRGAFLGGTRGVRVGLAFKKRLRAGMFGGEGFIMQRLQGDGWCFLNAGGNIKERVLAPGEILRVDTGCIVGFVPSVDYDIEMVGGIKSALFGGEGLFFATLRGPGKVWLQSLPLSRMAQRIYAAMPRVGRGGREEGSILGGLGRLLDGDNS